MLAGFLAWNVGEKIVALAAGYLLLRFGLATGALWIARSTPFGRRHRVYAPVEPPGQVRDEAAHLVAICLFDAVFLGFFFSSDAPTYVPATVLNVVSTTLLAILFNEFSFYLFHRLLHTRPLAFLHAQHHLAKVPDPFTAFSFSLAEHVTILPPSTVFLVLLSWVAPVSFEGVVTFAVVSEVLACYGHTNVETWRPGFPGTPLGQLLMTPTWHAMHHARVAGNYGLFTRIPDRLFGSEHRDYASLHHRAASGDTLPTLATRGAEHG